MIWGEHGVGGENSMTTRLSYATAPNTFTSESFPQLARHGKMANAKQSSSWKGSSEKMIDFSIYYGNSAQGWAS
jgi:hypothetical protein